MHRQFQLALVSCVLAAGLGFSAVAWAGEPQIELVAKPAQKFERAIETHKRELRELRERRERARERREESFGLAAGVSQSTLDAIASCESGGDPTVVDSSGTYYGKYQFDLGTWASVGGSGSPTEASEAEQDYRASLLYSRAGSSPWPICGA